MKTYTIITSIFFLFLVSSCEKKGPEVYNTKAEFSYVTDGFRADFSDRSTNALEYAWDFGDGEGQSTEKDPSYFYKEKGEFTVTLTVKNGDQTSTFEEIITIEGPNILIDGGFDDWEQIGYTASAEDGTAGGKFKVLKTYTSSEYIFFYLEGTEDMELNSLNLLINKDNNVATGRAYWWYPAGAGVEFMCEGTVNKDDPELTIGTIYAYNGADGAEDWSWNPIVDFVGGNLQFSRTVVSGGVARIEFALKRSVVGDPTDEITFALVNRDASYNPESSIPVWGLPTSQFLTLEL
ncbi:MAG TPA: PKD domain-containing protein [Sphingobacterium sp.]|nr:PKD domain-containing protein [Sphingobacterium sp.]